MARASDLPTATQLAELLRQTDEDIRLADVQAFIDPGFMNHRLIRTFLTTVGADDLIKRANMAADQVAHPHERELTRSHNYVRLLLDLCQHFEVPSLSAHVSAEEPTHAIVCSTDRFQGRRFGSAVRAEVRWRPSIRMPVEAKLRFSTEHIFSSTHREELSRDSILAHISRFKEVSGSGEWIYEPLVIGAPWLDARKLDPQMETTLMFHHYDFFQIFVEDVDEFKEVRAVGRDCPEWQDVMSKVSEHAFKEFLCGLLSGDEPRGDWGGEMSDHFSTSVHIRGRRVSAAFALKGPARFSPMKATHLGKNGDQLYRLSCEPCQLLVLQHCHDVTEAVLAQLRAFSVQPSNARSYLVIDGRDSYRLLRAYGAVEQALETSDKKAARPARKSRTSRG